MREVGVIYLYRFAEGEHPVLHFLESYRRHPAGIDHDLYVVFKGFPDQASLAAGRALFAEIPFTSIELDDFRLRYWLISSRRKDCIKQSTDFS